MNKKIILIAIAALFTVNVWGQITQTQEGYVGINNSSPNAMLVVGPTSTGAPATNGYNQIQLGALMFLGRDNYDSYIMNNTYYNSSNSWSYTYTGRGATMLQNYNGRFIFNTAPSGIAGNNITFTERMRISENGNVGIGTTSPTSNLHISASSNPEFLLRSESTGQRGLWLKVDDDQQIVAISSGYHVDGAYPMIFRVNGYENMRISKNGNVGIGTLEPSSKLEIKAIGEGASLLRLSTERPWEFIQMYEGGNTGLGLRSTVPSKSFFILSKEGNQIARFSAMDNPSEARIFFLKDGGRVGIGTTSPSYTLSVKGNIGCGEVIVENVNDWSDFVFEPDYNLMTLKDLETFIKINKHLPEIPTTAEVEKDGISVGEMNAKLLQKIEELTLYMIELKKENIELNKKVDALIQK